MYHTDVYWTIHVSVSVGYPMFGSKPLHDPMLTYDKFDTWEQNHIMIPASYWYEIKMIATESVNSKLYNINQDHIEELSQTDGCVLVLNLP